MHICFFLQFLNLYFFLFYLYNLIFLYYLYIYIINFLIILNYYLLIFSLIFYLLFLRLFSELQRLFEIAVRRGLHEGAHVQLQGAGGAAERRLLIDAARGHGVHLLLGDLVDLIDVGGAALLDLRHSSIPFRGFYAIERPFRASLL